MQPKWWEIVIFVAIVGSVAGGVFYGRSQALAIYGDDVAQGEWDTWREDATQMSEGIGPVKRRAPKSLQPPALVLMSQYFGVCLVGSVLLSSVLTITILAFVRGVMSSPTMVDRSRDQSPAATARQPRLP
ncbi:hypothetical protein Psta_2081 [Pirellula staleyi DSM 6068]|uniref:Uncharacterized protein n=1 Tax=Pirellula staleyi (strain ATCC 27377 / DSM 6068 / ICPB 4128) TaxID=530564 RepID=D2R1N6_PIRSD|nr:hypothetical protein [Pirellula staleyi]ADB16755.1 hypothetical protein Psta_2081 [Pirellula staleyi DSM 6068]